MLRTTRFAMFALLAILVAGASTARADIVLTDDNSEARINPSSDAGMHTWLVDGVDQMYQQWFFYRVEGLNGNLAAGLQALGTPLIDEQTATGVRLTYTNSLVGLQIKIKYSMMGGTAGSYTSDIGEQISVINNTGYTVAFFQYSDFDLNGTPSGLVGQTVTVDSGRAIQSGDGVEMAETSLVRLATFYEANTFPTTLNSILNTAGYDLNNTASAGPGDATWAFQWDLPTGTTTWSKDKNIRAIPEPMSIVLLGSVMLGVAGLIRRRRA